MSEIILNKDKNIKEYDVIKYSYDGPSNNNCYLFEITITFSSNDIIESKSFSKIENSKECEIINSENKLFFDNLLKFHLAVTKIPDVLNNIYTLEDNIDHSNNFFIKKDENLYCEFIKNDIDYTICTVQITDNSQTNFSISPSI